MIRGARVFAASLWWATTAWACYEERVRPGPPEVELILNRTEVQSPDTLGGRLRAVDPDGIDSAWVLLDSVPGHEVDGFLEEVVEEPFVLDIPPGETPGARITVRIEARDVLGFVGRRDTFVTVAFPTPASGRDR